MNQVQKNLLAAKELILDPEHWMKNEYCDSLCSRYCVVGAVSMAVTGKGYPSGKFEEESRELYFLRAAIGGNVIRFNDRHMHEEVLAAFDKAIELAADKNV